MPSGRRSSKRPYGQPHRELDVDRLRGAVPRIEIGPRGEEFEVAVPRPSDKTYVCPGCSQEISGQLPHVVAWPRESVMGPDAAVAARRHWHTNCWATFGRHGG